ncbi:hypothetical protein HD806DRAFT_502193 [Xylariaceae sp. AK1471]|nr:hypothetical protein HD806DRAFT_502193 [Xylariaceae sp. AK1471]
MTHKPARSLPAAERRALAGENDSQDSQEKLLFLIHQHGVGVTTSSPTPDDIPRQSIRAQLATAPTSNLAAEGEKQLRPPEHPKNASNAPVDGPKTIANACTGAALTSSVNKSSQRPCRPRSSAPRSSASASPELKSAAQISARSVRRDVGSVDQPPSPLIRNDALPQVISPTAPLKKQTRGMSSQSPTQSNDGRSYEQYAHAGSQPSSTPESITEEPRTLHEGDTGYVDFKYPFDLPNTDPNEPDTPSTRNNEHGDLHERSQFTSQMATARTNRFAPETPTVFSKPFLAGGNGQLMGASQLFGQTQPTSGLKKASPTSSRPSPNIFQNTVTSPTHPTSSPLKNRGFGTTPLPNFVSTSPVFSRRSSRPLDSRTSQSPSLVDTLDEAEDRDEDEASKTLLPKLDSYRGRSGLEPIDEYRPYRKQILDSEATRSSSQHSVDSDFERDEAEFRRQRARSNKERASKSFPEISVPLPSSGKAKVVVPSTSRAKRSKDFARTDSEEYLAQCHGKCATNNADSQETVADSQDAILQQQTTIRSDALDLPARDHIESVHDDPIRPLSAPMGNVEEKEMIPETSPACTSVEPPKLIGDILGGSSSASSGQHSMSFPTPSAVALIEPSDSLNKPSTPEADILPADVPNSRDNFSIDSVAIASSPFLVPESSQQNTGRRSGRLSKLATPSSTATEVPPPSDPGSTSSALTVLSTTPVVSSSMTPNTEDDHGRKSPENTVTASSPAVDRVQRREPPTSSLPDPSLSLARQRTTSRPWQSFRKGLRQSSRHSSLSLDDLEKSPSVLVTEDSGSGIRKLLRKSTTLRDFQIKRGIFEGMVFAISVSERQQSQKGKGKSVSKSNLEGIIRREGGKILADGFDSLFKFDTLPTSANAPSTPVLSSSLKLLDTGIGFAALIADGHSRKVKYMQALALGIPCLAPRWVTSCVSKKEVVDWSSYLLCAGSSTLLGDAIRSRNILPYDASTAKLADIIFQRPKLLEGSRILLIMKKTKNEEKRLPYVFLAQVLGASLVRVHSVEEARAKLREAECGDNGFDWVYVDDHLQDARTALFGSGTSEGPSKKRKRKSTSTDMGDDRPPKRIRTLNDELVIQSLILGRLIEEEEMEE